MEKDLIHTIYKLDIIEGKSKVNLNELTDLVLKHSSKRLSNLSFVSRYEDTYCPDSPLINQVICEMRESVKKYMNEDIEIHEKWAHIHEKNMSASPHIHGDSFLSSVLYLKVPEGAGQLIFDPLIFGTGKKYSARFPPKEGTYYIFPGYLKHFVTRNTSNYKRISISFNFLKKPNFNCSYE